MIEEIDLDEWKRRSQKGEVCGIVNCYEKPTNQCPKCLNHYCYEHLGVHFHVMTDEESKDQENSKKELT